jgi:hypothetical protein
VHLHADEFWHFLRGGRIDPWRPESQGQNRVVIDALSHAASCYAAGGYEVLLDGIVGPWFLDRLLSVATTLGVGVRYLVLRPTLEVALSRIRGRNPQPIDEAGVRRMHEEFAILGRFEANVIDTSSLSEAVTTEIVGRSLSDPRFLVARHSGWDRT